MYTPSRNTSVALHQRLHVPSWLAVALFFLTLATGVAGCGSTDANEGEDDPPETSPSPSFAVSPGNVSYGDVDTENSEEAVVTITNNGDVVLEGRIEIASGADHFSTSESGNYDVASGSTQEVTVTFSPNAEGDLNGSLSITHNAENTSSPAVVSLSGRGIVELADPPNRP